ncbi:metalloregulator ArsR/SmtB family transcription factor [Streptomyces angustmyceticus]|nr:metalloregulator ArsR/SmtB family transcription factor [Streptomyces angustmyceticus]
MRGRFRRIGTETGARGAVRARSRKRGGEVNGAWVPLCQAKAEFFRMLGHPVRLRVLELLQSGPMPVRQLLSAIEVEPSALSQQLAVLRRSGIVTATRSGSTVVYELAGGEVAELLRAARRVLAEVLDGQHALLAELRQAETGAVPAADGVGAVT